MNKIYKLFILLILFSCKQQNKSPIKIINEIIDIGAINKNEKSNAYFYLINTGEKSLEIQNILTDCHCTVTDWSKKTWVSGDTLSIKASYDNHTLGFFEQTASVYIKGTNQVPLLIMRGIVIE